MASSSTELTLTSSPPKLTLKLFIDTKREKVVFAEASNAVVDFMFDLLHLPLNTVTRLVKTNGTTVIGGSLGNLYDSAENMDESYMKSNLLMMPRALFFSEDVMRLLLSNDSRIRTTINGCPQHNNFVTCDNQSLCPRFDCRLPMTNVVYCAPNNKGLVREDVSYIVTDDLVIQPIHTIPPISNLQEKVVQLGKTEVVNLLKASLESKMVLTTVFLKNNTIEILGI